MRTKIVKAKRGKIVESKSIWTVDIGAWLQDGWETEDSFSQKVNAKTDQIDLTEESSTVSPSTVEKAEDSKPSVTTDSKHSITTNKPKTSLIKEEGSSTTEGLKK